MSFLYPNFNNQFNKTYKIRLQTLKHQFEYDSNSNVLETILDLNTTKSLCIITGILFISTDLKTTIFDKLKQDEAVFDIKKRTYFTKDIKYFLEDETGRIELQMAENFDLFVTTGMCLSISGFMNFNKFEVKNIIFPKNIIDTKKQKSEKLKIAFASGIHLDFSIKNNDVFKVITDYVYLNGIDKLVIFGNFFDQNFETLKNFIENSEFEIILIPDYMDFNCKTFPLLPVHKKLFNKEVNSLMNPCLFKIKGTDFLFTSLFIIKDLFKYLFQNINYIQESGDGFRMHINKEPNEYLFNDYNNKKSFLKVISGMIGCKLMCPTAPDTISCIPYDEKELFFIETIPKFIIVPNYDNVFLEKLIDFDSCVLTVPNFKNTHKIVVLDVDSQNFETIEM